MLGIVIAVILVLVITVLYSCLVMASENDRMMENLEIRREKEAGMDTEPSANQ